MPAHLTDEMIEEYVTGSCSARQEEAIESHISSCSSCGRKVEAARSMEAGLDKLREIAIRQHPELRAESDGASSEAHDSHGASGSSVELDVFRKGLTSPRIKGYEIRGEIGGGSQGIVYEAIHRITEERVAIKVLFDRGPRNAKCRERFKREAKLVVQLDHPNIVRINDAGIANGRPYVVMRYVDGDPLDKHLEDARATITDKVRLLERACTAMGYAHSMGVIHRDLKPSNILVDEKGEPHIVDFGLAKHLDQSDRSLVTSEGDFVGTLKYTSPEQVSGKPTEVDVRTDVYSLGVILCRLLTGAFPYPVDGAVGDLIRHIQEREPRILSSAPDSVAPSLRTIILNALAKDKSDRYADAGELASDLRRYMKGESVKPRPRSVGRRIGRALRRKRGGVAAAAVLAAVSVLVASRFHNEPNTPQVQSAVEARAGFHNKPFEWAYSDGDRFRTNICLGRNSKEVDVTEGYRLKKSLSAELFLTADLDRDGGMDWVLANEDSLEVRDSNGALVWSRRFAKPVRHLFVDDIDTSPGLEIIGSCNSKEGEDTVFAITSRDEGAILFQVSKETICPRRMADLENDGTKEIIATLGSGHGRHRRGVWVFDYEARKVKWEFETGCQTSHLIVDDVDDDGKREIVVCMMAPHNRNSANGFTDDEAWVVCFEHDGKILWKANLGTWGLEPAYADLDGDGRKRLVIYRCQDWYGGNASVYRVDPRTGKVEARYDGLADDACQGCIVGDLDGDGKAEVVAAFPEKERCLRVLDNWMREKAKLSEPEIPGAAGDLGGDERLEVVTRDREGPGFYVRDSELKLLWSGRVPEGNAGRIIISDLDCDGVNDIVVQGHQRVYIYCAEGQLPDQRASGPG